jgi:hypothetical protein
MSNSNSIPTPESLKEKAPIIRKFIKEKYNVDVSQGHSLELISKVFGFKDWNSASAMTKTKPKPVTKENERIVRIRTVGGMKKALAPYPDSAKLEATSLLVVKNFIDAMTELNIVDGALNQEYSFILEQGTDSEVTLGLKLENETLSEWDHDIPEATDEEWNWDRDTDVE